MLSICTKCAAEVPQQNIILHELRCPGSMHPARGASAARADRMSFPRRSAQTDTDFHGGVATQPSLPQQNTPQHPQLGDAELFLEDLEGVDTSGLQRSNSSEALPSPAPWLIEEDIGAADRTSEDIPLIIIGNSSHSHLSAGISNMVNVAFGYERVIRNEIIGRLRCGDDLSRANRVLHLALCGDRVVGCASSSLAPSWTVRGCGHWGLLAVAQEAQGRDVAAALVEAAEQRLATKCRQIQIEYDYTAGCQQSQQLRYWYEGQLGFRCISAPHSSLRICRKRIGAGQRSTSRRSIPSTASIALGVLPSRELRSHGATPTEDRQVPAAPAENRIRTQQSRNDSTPSGYAGGVPAREPPPPCLYQPPARNDRRRADRRQSGTALPASRPLRFRSQVPQRSVSDAPAVEASSTNHKGDAFDSGSFVDALPLHRLTLKDVEGMQAELSECAICLDEYQVGDEQLTLSCFHRFHSACAKSWLSKSMKCPICKIPQDFQTCPAPSPICVPQHADCETDSSRARFDFL